MTLTSMLFLTLTGSLIFLKLGLITLAVLLLLRAMAQASHPGAMDPNYAEIGATSKSQPRGVSKG